MFHLIRVGQPFPLAFPLESNASMLSREQAYLCGLCPAVRSPASMSGYITACNKLQPATTLPLVAQYLSAYLQISG